MKEMFNILIRNKLTPNRFYVLWAINQKLTTPLVNTEAELRILKRENWLSEDNKLTNSSKKLIKEIESHFKVIRKKSSTDLMGDGFLDNIKKFNLIYPNKKLPSGQAARSAISNLESAFRWFFANNEFSWDTIFKATTQYINERERQNWNFTRKSQYFVRKQYPDKTWDSLLADFCTHIESGGENYDTNHFKEKVF